ncbi:hypothetical protein N7931_18685 [Catenovulum sp. 2E275]|uniref:hypothetical protein n=1 Tax=Catenovulum sp. 2E275 TaxID=2980497 RepID=UPI0021CF418A|nr:hypothetical protein [Catenovulum sp. 2E275]MCU4677646.1 hypothetical protein [Catenovulum sp. 2E275]
MSSKSKVATIANFMQHEYSHHRWEYLTFTAIVFVSFVFAFLSEITHLNDAVNYLVGGDFNLAQEIRQAPLEHFAPSTIAYGTTFLYLLISGFRIVCGTQQTAVNWFKSNLLAPLINFYSTLCRAMLGGLIGITILTILFDFKSYLWIFFFFSFIYPGIIMLIVQSMAKLIEPIAGLKIDRGFLGTRIVGLLMIALALVSGLAVYLIDLIGKALL